MLSKLEHKVGDSNLIVLLHNKSNWLSSCIPPFTGVLLTNLGCMHEPISITGNVINSHIPVAHATFYTVSPDSVFFKSQAHGTSSIMKWTP